MTAQLPDGSTTGATALDLARGTTARSWPWLRAALLLAGAAQLITISALLGMDSPAATWARLLLAIAPVLLAAAAAFLAAPARLVAVVLACIAIVAGIAGGRLPTGVLFFPALAALIGAGFLLLRDRS
jgi:hypothetical protein